MTFSLHRLGLCLKASLRRGKRLSPQHGRPDSAVPWIKALTSMRWQKGHNWTSLSPIKCTGLYLRKSRRVSLQQMWWNATLITLTDVNLLTDCHFIQRKLHVCANNQIFMYVSFPSRWQKLSNDHDGYHQLCGYPWHGLQPGSDRGAH